MNLTAKTPEPPYYAVIFTSQREEADNGYAEMAKRMEELATKQEGFLGIESARDNELGITVSYWASLEAIKNWKSNVSHQIAQKRGKEEWYQNYHVRISKVERDYFID